MSLLGLEPESMVSQSLVIKELELEPEDIVSELESMTGVMGWSQRIWFKSQRIWFKSQRL